MAVLGLAYKGGTDDVRESPAMRLVQLILAEGATIVAYDPAAMIRAQEVLPPTAVLHYAATELETATDADALLVLTDWPQFLSLDLQVFSRLLRHPLLIDGRNLFAPEDVVRQGMMYLSVGRPAAGTTEFEGQPELSEFAETGASVPAQYPVRKDCRAVSGTARRSRQEKNARAAHRCCRLSRFAPHGSPVGGGPFRGRHR